MRRYMRPLLERIEAGDIDPSFVISHTAAPDDGPEMYKTFRDEEDGCIKVVIKPNWDGLPGPVARAVEAMTAE